MEAMKIDWVKTAIFKQTNQKYRRQPKLAGLSNGFWFT